MRITARGSYAVRALVDLASQPGTRPISLREIAARGHISISYLEQLFLKLRRCNLVRSVRGPGGGYLLAKGPETITVAEVIEAVEERIEPIYCVRPSSDRTCSLESCCAAHVVWKGLAERMRDYLSSVSLEEMVKTSETLRTKATPSTGGGGADPTSIVLAAPATEGKP
jgi:Rrf2 family iron-sulfur cluster assembly transcriptional regulator